MNNAEAENVGWVSDSVTQQSQDNRIGETMLGYAALTQPTTEFSPAPWIRTTLGQIIEFKYGKSLPDKTRDGNGYPVYGSNGKVGQHSIPLVKGEGVIVGRKGSFGEVQYSSIPFFPIDTTYYVDHFFSQPTRYWYYQLKFLPLTKLNRSTAIPGLNREDAYSLEIALPPIAEQHQIATKLDELLAQVDSIKTRLDTIPKILKRFRQSVLAAAVSGKLTEDWRGSASIDFNQSPVTIGVESDTAPKGWNWQKLVDLAILESGHTPRKSVPEYWKNGDVYWICLQDIRAAHGSIINDTLHKPTMLGIDNSSARLLPAGTVCFSRDISVGYTTIMGKEMSTTQHFANWICGDNLNNKFLMFALMVARDHLLISGQGTTVKTIYMPALKEFRLLTPPLKEQTEIVRRVDQLLAYVDQIEQRVKDAQARVNHLTQSILAKAFRGELTADWRAQNPDLITGEHSAEALLEEILNQAHKLKRTRKSS